MCRNGKEGDVIVRFNSRQGRSGELHYDGFTYALNKTNSTRKYWSCVQAGCKATAILTNNNVLQFGDDQHNHEKRQLMEPVRKEEAEQGKEHTVNTKDDEKAEREATVPPVLDAETDEGQELHCDGFTYKLNRSEDNKKYYICVQPGCKSNAVFIDNSFLEFGDELHIHGKNLSAKPTSLKSIDLPVPPEAPTACSEEATPKKKKSGSVAVTFSTRNGEDDELHCDGFVYKLSSSDATSKYYYCTSPGCKSRAVLIDNYALEFTHDRHNHERKTTPKKPKAKWTMESEKDKLVDATDPSSKESDGSTEGGTLSCDGYSYKFTSIDGASKYYKCSFQSCKATAILIDNNAIEFGADKHNHGRPISLPLKPKQVPPPKEVPRTVEEQQNLEPSVTFGSRSGGGVELHYDGYTYRLSKNRGYRKYWACTQPGCRGSAVLINNSVLEFGENPHIHPKRVAPKYKREDFKHWAKELALSKQIKAPAVVDMMVREVDEDAKQFVMQNKEYYLRHIRMVRWKNGNEGAYCSDYN